MRAVQQQVWAVEPDMVFALLDPLPAFLHKLTYATPEFGVIAFTPLAGLALLLATAGVFSVTAYTVSLRIQEIGIRMALGAQHSHALRMVLSKALASIAVGLLLGVVATAWLSRLLESQLWGISRMDPLTLVGVGLLMLVAGSIASYFPARAATQVSPMEALRSE